MLSELNFTENLPNESLSIIESVNHPLITSKNLILDVKREDLIHPYLSGNKWRKLKYNLLEAKRLRHQTLLTFGGAFSNHLYATAAAGKLYKFNTIGVVRGDELKAENSTLAFAQQCGMELKFVTRENYRLKNDSNFIESLQKEFGEFYLLPEGGTNKLAIEGCKEILKPNDYLFYDYIMVMIGTGGTFAGILSASNHKSTILGVSALKGKFVSDEIEKIVKENGIGDLTNYSILTEFHHGGYAKTSDKLEAFMQEFTFTSRIPVEFVYTGKLFYSIFELVKADFFKPNSKILAIHTGGLRK